MKAKVPANMTECFQLIERDFFVGPFAMGETFTVVDAYLFTISNWLEADGVDTSQFPRILTHRALMLERPSVQRAIEL